MKRRSRLDIRKYSFGLRVVDGWNGLGEGVVNSGTVNGFKMLTIGKKGRA